MNDFTKKIKYEFKNTELLTEALTHKSYANEHGENGRDNERLEFLGDAVLSIVTAQYLFELSPPLPEGELTKIRAALVCEQTLFEYAQGIDLGAAMLLGRGEELTGGRERPSIVSDCFEALIAAIYIDGGVDAAREFVLGFVRSRYEGLPVMTDYKTRLQELVQQNRTERLRYVVVSEDGPDHDKLFTVEVHLNSNVVGTGRGHSKKQAEQLAAREALALMGL